MTGDQSLPGIQAGRLILSYEQAQRSSILLPGTMLYLIHAAQNDGRKKTSNK